MTPNLLLFYLAAPYFECLALLRCSYIEKKFPLTPKTLVRIIITWLIRTTYFVFLLSSWDDVLDIPEFVREISATIWRNIQILFFSGLHEWLTPRTRFHLLFLILCLRHDLLLSCPLFPPMIVVVSRAILRQNGG